MRASEGQSSVSGIAAAIVAGVGVLAVIVGIVCYVAGVGQEARPDSRRTVIATLVRPSSERGIAV